MYEEEEERVVCCQVGRVVWGCSTLTCKTDVPIIFMRSEVDVCWEEIRVAYGMSSNCMAVMSGA